MMMTEELTINEALPEAPYSWNVRYYDASGFECQLTVREFTGKDLFAKATSAIEWLNGVNARPRANGKPAQQPPAPPAAPVVPPATLPDGEIDPGWCAIHAVSMSRHEKDGQAWYSHKVGDSWCKGK